MIIGLTGGGPRDDFSFFPSCFVPILLKNFSDCFLVNLDDISVVSQLASTKDTIRYFEMVYE